MAEDGEKSLVSSVSIEINREALSWPGPGGAADDSGLGCNRQYFDLRGVGWRSVSDMLHLERGLLDRVKGAVSRADEAASIWEEFEAALEADDMHPLWGLDLGVASATLALSAAGCVTFASCNGGAFGEGPHQEAYPLVAFFMRSKVASQIEAAATQAGVGLLMHADGSVQVYGPSPWALHEFATCLHERRGLLRAANRARGAPPPEGGSPEPNLDLFD